MVVKINAKFIVMGILMIVLLAGIVNASRQALEFSDVDVKVGSKTDKGLKNGETISDEAEPGDAAEFRIEVKNNYTSAENLDIENIQITVRIESIDDGDDLEEEASDFDLRPGSDKRATLRFQVPLEVDEDDFDVIIEAEGEDENGTDQNIRMTLKLEVDKESHRLILTRNTLTPAEISCSRKNVQAGVGVLNIGSEDEENVNIHILNQDLGVDIKEDIGELEADPLEETSKFSKAYSFNVPADTEAGSYPVIIRALYDDDRRKAEETVTLTVSDCSTAKPQPTAAASEKKEELDLSSAPQNAGTAGYAVQQIPPGTTISTEGFGGSGFAVAAIIAVIIAVVVGIILLIVSLVARRS
ncbi:hypothetical protein HYX06_05070 [Candidatus Woesearchaeota archaeon]|nr:hypothetical protein [Candidatus Woesearchaeota archaeon]